MKDLTGVKYNYNFTNIEGEEITQILTIVSNDRDWVLFDNGDKYPLSMVYDLSEMMRLSKPWIDYKEF